jgi:hypothetical protein
MSLAAKYRPSGSKLGVDENGIVHRDTQTVLPDAIFQTDYIPTTARFGVHYNYFERDAVSCGGELKFPDASFLVQIDTDHACLRLGPVPADDPCPADLTYTMTEWQDAEDELIAISTLP